MQCIDQSSLFFVDAASRFHHKYCARGRLQMLAHHYTLTVSRIGGAVTSGRTHGQTVLTYSPKAGLHALAKRINSIAQSLHYTECIAEHG
jgi:hypothetical protein